MNTNNIQVQEQLPHVPGRPLFLCGMMGSGKSTIGHILAGKLNIPFTDLDREIVRESGISIPELFRRKGEEEFRRTERKVLMQIPVNSLGVIALGGGALQDQQIVDYIKIKGWLIFLDAPLSVLSKRLKSGSGRPLLQQTSGEIETRSRVDRLLRERRKYYIQAHITAKTGNRSPGSIADTIIQKVTLYES